MRFFTFLAAALVAVVLSTASSAAIIFSDDFESGSMSNWTTTGTNPLDISNAQNVVPAGGTYSALMNTSIDRMHHNLIADNGGSELSGYSTFTSYIYDTAAATRIFNEVRGYSGGTGLPNGGTTASGTLAQLLAIGKYNTVTMPGEVYNGNKYQARIVYPSATMGWFNLDGPGSPNRSLGWHKFTIERLADDTTINFYVDDILSRTIAGTTAQSWDTVVMGPGLGSTVGDAWIDGISIDNGIVIPEPTAIVLAGLACASLCAFRRRAV
jgi:hypothetical protein